ncbi:hypothetical protein B5E58_09010 [Tyzzerella sp. An114]|uniref:helix-turn-helix domain-containing protein n=1 Tax=Tyzzerella sp. An114 TaxID=1965545 RepID=UPI000B4429A1|nr:helix-turn-helix domain-containing protein [Tyzzerella sp. An114]OUQ57699.1 hypothetical protein B5E58_09010 [Tyzzerella sp. An114]
MNYILEIKAFYDWLEVNQLSTAGIVLWHALMHIANKTGWQDNFTVAIAVLEIKTGLQKKAIINARNNLKQAGLIDFISRTGNKSAIYKMNSFVVLKETQTEPQKGTQIGTQTEPQKGTINKQDELKQNNIKKKNNKKEKELSPFEQALVDFTDHRKALKKPLTEHGLKLIVSKLEKLEPVSVENRIKILEQSMVNGWTGIFPLKKEVSNYGYTGENETNQGNEQEYGYIGQTY